MDKAGKVVSQSLSLAGPAAASLGAAIQPLVSPVKRMTTEYAEEIGKKAANFASEHPGAVAGVAAGTAITAAPQPVTIPLLPAVGFGKGVAAGSLAAGVHSWIGNIAAGSWFAVCQSAGAGGAGVAVVNGAVQISGAAVGLAAAGAKYMLEKAKL